MFFPVFFFPFLYGTFVNDVIHYVEHVGVVFISIYIVGFGCFLHCMSNIVSVCTP